MVLFRTTALPPALRPGLVLLTLACSLASADVKPAALFGDHVVLQREAPVPVWGVAAAAEGVTVAVNGQQAQATAGQDGRWRAELPAQAAGGPFTLTIQGKNTVTINDVYFGDVWVCSGQSNMQFTVNGSKDAAQEIAAANFPLIRQFRVANVTADKPATEFPGKWEVCSPATAGGFTAAGYFFARKLHQDLKIPIGLLHTSWGGTNIESWISAAGVAQDPDTQKMYDRLLPAFQSAAEDRKTFLERLTTWRTANGVKDPGNQGFAKGWAGEAEVPGWKTIRLPGNGRAAGLKNGGVVWLRRVVELPAAGNATVQFNQLAQSATAYFNGVQVAELGHRPPQFWTERGGFGVPAKLVKPGKNILVLRVVGDTAGELAANLNELRVGNEKVSLHGEWQAQIETEFEALKPDALKSRPPLPLVRLQNLPASLYNAMVAPAIQYRIKGALWYQGENNAGQGKHYAKLMPLLISDWRKLWNQGDFPFYLVQLPNFMQQAPEPRDPSWPNLRWAQFLTRQALPNVGVAVTIELGEADDIHPKNKQDVGTRLALLAEAETYGLKVQAYGPWYQSAAVEGASIRVKFSSVGGGLVAKGGPLKYFAVAGEDGKYVWADARIDGATVVVSSPKVPQPKWVRYAWDDNPVGCNLYNQDGLPAAPFRTDPW